MLRLVAVGFALITLYYARFFVAIRQEASTIVQICILLLAAAVLVWPFPRWWRLTSAQIWAIALFAVGLGVAILVWADHGSHSISDTLTRAVPGVCLIAALVLRISLGRAQPHDRAMR
jgi:hypothetical protein